MATLDMAADAEKKLNLSLDELIAASKKGRGAKASSKTKPLKPATGAGVRGKLATKQGSAGSSLRRLAAEKVRSRALKKKGTAGGETASRPFVLGQANKKQTPAKKAGKAKTRQPQKSSQTIVVPPPGTGAPLPFGLLPPKEQLQGGQQAPALTWDASSAGAGKKQKRGGKRRGGGSGSSGGVVALHRLQGGGVQAKRKRTGKRQGGSIGVPAPGGGAALKIPLPPGGYGNKALGGGGSVAASGGRGRSKQRRNHKRGGGGGSSAPAQWDAGRSRSSGPSLGEGGGVQRRKRSRGGQRYHRKGGA